MQCGVGDLAPKIAERSQALHSAMIQGTAKDEAQNVDTRSEDIGLSFKSALQLRKTIRGQGKCV